LLEEYKLKLSIKQEEFQNYKEIAKNRIQELE